MIDMGGRCAQHREPSRMVDRGSGTEPFPGPGYDVEFQDRAGELFTPGGNPLRLAKRFGREREYAAASACCRIALGNCLGISPYTPGCCPADALNLRHSDTPSQPTGTADLSYIWRFAICKDPRRPIPRPDPLGRVLWQRSATCLDRVIIGV